MAFKAYIAEDSATVRQSLIETLQELAHVDAEGGAETAQDCISWLQTHSQCWSLAIVDLSLRESSGMNVLQACRKRRPEQKMVVFSSHTSGDMRKRCAQLGADAVFDKSSDIDKLLDYCIAERRKYEHRLV
ncbi:MAG TPA: response regulator [Burkholderiaceae bacterium]